MLCSIKTSGTDIYFNLKTRYTLLCVSFLNTAGCLITGLMLLIGLQKSVDFKAQKVVFSKKYIYSFVQISGVLLCPK